MQQKNKNAVSFKIKDMDTLKWLTNPAEAMKKELETFLEFVKKRQELYSRFSLPPASAVKRFPKQVGMKNTKFESSRKIKRLRKIV
jgi:hypothetical protein